jgi:hypothetical protein
MYITIEDDLSNLDGRVRGKKFVKQRFKISKKSIKLANINTRTQYQDHKAGCLARPLKLLRLKPPHMILNFKNHTSNIIRGGRDQVDSPFLVRKGSKEVMEPCSVDCYSCGQ